MKIGINNKINSSINNSPAFGRALTSDEILEYKKTLNLAKKKVGNDGMSVLIVHDACLPQSDS